MRSGKPIPVFPLVLELEVINGLKLREQLCGAAIKAQLKSPSRSNTHVMVTFRTHLCIALEIWFVEDGIAFDALLPETFGDTGAVGTLVLVHA